jgi:hypothetical protein
VERRKDGHYSLSGSIDSSYALSGGGREELLTMEVMWLHSKDTEVNLGYNL